MKKLKSHNTVLTEDAVIEGIYTKAIYIKNGATLTLKDAKKPDPDQTSFVGCLIRVEEGGTLIVEDGTDVSHVLVEGGTVIVKGSCFYIYLKAGKVTIDGGSVFLFEYYDCLTGGMKYIECDRELTVKNDGSIYRLVSDERSTIYVNDSIITHLEISNSTTLNLKNSHIYEGFYDSNGFIVCIGDTHIEDKVEISEYAHILNLPKNSKPMTAEEACEYYYKQKKLKSKKKK